ALDRGGVKNAAPYSVRPEERRSRQKKTPGFSPGVSGTLNWVATAYSETTTSSLGRSFGFWLGFFSASLTLKTATSVPRVTRTRFMLPNSVGPPARMIAAESVRSWLHGTA